MRIAATDEEARSRWASLPSLAGVVRLGGARPGASVLAVMDGLGTRAGHGRAAVRRRADRAFCGSGELALEDAAARLRRQLRAILAAGRALAHRRRAGADYSDPSGVGASRRPVRTPRHRAHSRYQPAPQDELLVRVEAPDGQTLDIVPSLTDPARGLFTARVPAADRGIYRAESRGRPAGAVGANGAAMARRRHRSRVGRSPPQRGRPETAGRGSGGRYATAEQATGRRLGRCGGCASRRGPPEWRDAWHTGWMFLSIVAAGVRRMGPAATVGAAMTARRAVRARPRAGRASPARRRIDRAHHDRGARRRGFVAPYTSWAEQMSTVFTDQLGFPPIT